MSDQVITLRFTADGKVAVSVAGQVEDALTGVGAAGQAGGKAAAAGMDTATRSTRQFGVTTTTVAATSQRSHRKIATGIESINTQLARVQKLASAWFAGAQVLQVVTGVARMADEYTNLASRTKLVTASQAQAASVQNEVFAIAQRTRSELSSTGDLYVKLAQSTKDMHLPQQQLLRMTETINKAFVVSGAGAAESAAAIQQLGQGLASGALRGDEFNSVAEQAPVIMDMLAKSLGVTRGELRGMAAEGKITADVLVNALGAGAADIDAKFGGMQLTISGAFTQLRNAVSQWVGEAGKATSVAALVADGIATIAAHIGTLLNVAGVALLAWLGKLAVGLVNSARLWAINTAEVIAYNVALSAGATRAAGAIAAIRGIGAALSTALGPISIGILVLGGLWFAFKKYMDGQQAAADAQRATIKSMDDIAVAARANAATYTTLAQKVQTYGAVMEAVAASAVILSQRQAALADVQRQLANTPVGWERERLQQRADALASSIAGLAGQINDARGSVQGISQDIATQFMPAINNALPGVLKMAAIGNFSGAFDQLRASLAGVIKADGDYNAGLGALKAQAVEASKALTEQNTTLAERLRIQQASILLSAKQANVSASEIVTIKAETDALIALIERQAAAANAPKRGDGGAPVTVNDDLHLGAANDAVAQFEAQTSAMAGAANEQRALLASVNEESDRLASGYYSLSRAQQQYVDTSKQAAAAMQRSIAAGRNAADAIGDYLDTMLEAGKQAKQEDKNGLAAGIDQLLESVNQQGVFDPLVAQAEALQKAMDAAIGAGMQDKVKELQASLDNVHMGMLIQGSMNALRALQTFTKEGSKEYAAMRIAIDALGIAQSILAFKSATVAVLEQGKGDPYTAWARMAAMAATVAPLLADVGQTISGIAGSGFTDTAAQRQASQGTGTVLGDAEAKSESIAHAVELTAKAAEKLVGINTGMLRALQSLQAALSSAGTMLARGAGEADFSGFDLSVEGDILGRLFGGKTKITDQGIQIFGGALGDLLENITLGAYQEVQSKTWAFGSTHTKEATQALSGEITTQFQLILDSIANAVSEGAKALGLNMDAVNKAIAEYQIESQKISLMGLSAEDQQKALEAVFSSIFDGLAGAVVPFIDQFQQVGEGLGETLVRVATEVQVMQQAVKYLGLTVATTDPEQYAQIADGLIQMAGGVEDFITQMQSFTDAFAPSEYKFQLASDALNSAFDQLGLMLPSTRDGMWALMQSLDATTEAGREQIAALLGLTDTADAYYSMLEKAQKDALARQQEIAKAQVDYALLSASLQAEAGANPLAQKILEIGQWSLDTSAKLQELAQKAGMAAARESDLALVHQVAVKRMEAAIAALYESSQALVDQLYGTGDSATQATRAVSSFGDAMGDAAQKATDAINLLLGNLSPLKDGAKLQLALQGQLAGTVRPEQVLEIAQRLYASTARYKEIFAQVMAVGDRTQRGGASAGGGANAAMKEVAQKTLSKAERYQMADQLAHNIANLSEAQKISFEDVAAKLGLDLADLGKDLGIGNDQLQSYLKALASDNFGLSDLRGLLTGEVDRLIQAIGGKPIFSASIDASGLHTAPLDDTNNTPISVGHARIPATATATATAPTFDPALLAEIKRLGDRIDAMGKLQGNTLPRLADAAERTAQATGQTADDTRELVDGRSIPSRGGAPAALGA